MRDLVVLVLVGAMCGCGGTGSSGTAGSGGAGGDVALQDEYVLSDQELVPESGSYDPVDGAFYVSSETQGSITRVDADGTETLFFEPMPSESLRTLGLTIDAEARRLWVCVDDSASAGVGGGGAGRPRRGVLRPPARSAAAQCQADGRRSGAAAATPCSAEGRASRHHPGGHPGGGRAALRSAGQELILIHGGAETTNEVAESLGHPPQFVTSERGYVSSRTDRRTLEIFEMVYCGQLNKGWVEKLQTAGVNAVGLAGVFQFF